MQSDASCDYCGAPGRYPLRFAIVSVSDSGTELRQDFKCCHAACAMALAVKYFAYDKEKADLKRKIIDLERDLREKEDSDRL